MYSPASDGATGVLAAFFGSSFLAGPASIASNTSPLRILPFGPVPTRVVKSIPLFEAIILAAGLAKSLSPVALGAAAGVAAAAWLIFETTGAASTGSGVAAAYG